MPTDLPYAAEAETSLSPDELEVLRRQYYKEIEQGHVSVQSKFNYGWGLIKSGGNELQTEGIKLLQEIYSASPDHRRECTYYIAVGYYKLGNYAYARKFNNLLLSVEPENMQAKSLGELIEGAVKRDGLIGIGLITGAVALTGLVLGSVLHRNRR
ncbi:mitochondria fission 1 protein [Cryptococcus wingfieldii CBS 7118]|uniref:Mitochondrial fission 1 protein n=2 Tax=Cryptococcus TaxID=5206 RepID=A0A1E3JI63_9TREE|nr:mitochondria fission 1 protein [Cryptococcus wingfieldii CBS 7118]ODO00535.1 mitochondria fission 1 protein [Cryptococcus wingfieldii CBS 7118]TYJ52536.1 mitochondria fission 1 protein [Cryptococcus floricola]